MTDILETAQESVAKAQAYLTRAKAAVGQCAMRDGKLDGAMADRHLSGLRGVLHEVSISVRSAVRRE